jgi:cytochrome c553
MRQHFDLVMAVNEALVRGELPVATQKAAALADRPDPQDLPAQAAPYLATMRLAAARAAAAVQLEDVAAASAAMLATCGDCHRAVGTMPANVLPPSPTVGGQVGHMLTHQQAVDLMVQGLTVPSTWLWQSGAEALERAPLRKAVSSANKKLSKDLLEAERSVHNLAERARLASDQRSRIYVYSELAQSCATCHSRRRDGTDLW